MNSKFALFFIFQEKVIVRRKPPNPAKKWNLWNFLRSEVAVLRQMTSYTRPRVKRSFCEVERRDSSVKRWGKNKSQRSVP
jgi:hypothetical protein